VSVKIGADTRVLVLTGAGVSAESGIPTFRDANGLWNQHRFEDVASPEGFRKDPQLVWRFYSERRAKARPCVPNAGHRALVALEERLGDGFLLVTQNVDGLHASAGSRRMVELHGNLYTTRCSRCDREPFPDVATYEDRLPTCACGGLLRPHIVWFGEMLDPTAMERITAFIRDSAQHDFVFLAVGTSGAVWPAAGLVRMAAAAGADTWLVNADPADNADEFAHFVRGKSGEVLPGLLGTG
jgi:NAD-dependent deacetylase